MDKKYIHKAIALDKESGERLERVRDELANIFGFRPSLSESVQYLCKIYLEKTAKLERTEEEVKK